MFDSSWELRIFSLFHTRDNTTKTCFSISLPTPKLTISLIQYKFISTLRLFYLKAGAELRGVEKPCNNVFCYIDHSGNFPENSELMLKPLNSWMGLLEKHKHYRLPPTEQYEPLQVCLFCRWQFNGKDNFSFLGGVRFWFCFCSQRFSLSYFYCLDDGGFVLFLK